MDYLANVAAVLQLVREDRNPIVVGGVMKNEFRFGATSNEAERQETLLAQDEQYQDLVEEFSTTRHLTTVGEAMDLQQVEAVIEQNPDRAFKVWLIAGSFLSNYCTPAMERRASGLSGHNSDHDWVSARQRKMQNHELNAFAEVVFRFVKSTGGPEVWDQATYAHRRAAFAWCYDDSPLEVSARLLRKWTEINVSGILCVDIRKCPQAAPWRRFLRERFLDLCELSYRCKVMEPTEEMNDLRQTTWKWLTRISSEDLDMDLGKYSRMGLQDTDVPICENAFDASRGRYGALPRPVNSPSDARSGKSRPAKVQGTEGGWRKEDESTGEEESAGEEVVGKESSAEGAKSQVAGSETALDTLSLLDERAKRRGIVERILAMIDAPVSTKKKSKQPASRSRKRAVDSKGDQRATKRGRKA